MQDETITYAAEPRVVSDTVAGQHEALMDAIEAAPDDYTQLSNHQWCLLFGLYWGLRQIMGLERWRRLWAQTKRHRQQRQPDDDATGWDLLCWLEDARDWRRDQARTQSGRGKRRWTTLQNSPKKHAAHKAGNRDAQRARRARQLSEVAE